MKTGSFNSSKLGISVSKKFIKIGLTLVVKSILKMRLNSKTESILKIAKIYRGFNIKIKSYLVKKSDKKFFIKFSKLNSNGLINWLELLKL